MIAEIKKRSPSKGELAAALNVASRASLYENGGAAAISVLTDSEFFGGSMEDLVTAREATGLPVLRKDFTVDIRDLFDARIAGADAVLLIVAALDEAELIEFHQLAGELGLAALVEVHDEEEIARALRCDPQMIGVNQRDLRTFEVDAGRAERLRTLIPDHVVSVAESGISGPDDARRMSEAGFDAILVGEALVTSDDPVSTLRSLMDAA